MQKKLKRIAIDSAGYGLILLALLIGWLPGPGGIPLVLAGLGLLSVHNRWAKRFLKYLQTNGIRLAELGFPDNKWVQAFHDIFVVVLLVTASYLMLFQRNAFTIGIVIALCAMAIADALYNRSRLRRLRNK